MDVSVKKDNHRNERAKKMMQGGGYKQADLSGSDGPTDARKPVFKYKSGGSVAHGESSKKRLDKPKRYASGGGVDESPKKKSAKTQVNIIISGKGDNATPPAPAMMPPAPPAPPPPPPSMPMPGAARPPMGGPAPAMGRPGPMKRGGAVKKNPSYPIEDGAGGGMGRLEKAAAAKKSNHGAKKSDS